MFPSKQKLLSAAQLKRLGEHKYKSDSCSLLDPHLQVYWNWLVSKVPISLAPNLITIVGLYINILTTLILIWFSPNAKTQAPQWAFLLCAIGLFIYQSLDAIDGKQARRTDSSSPLGELFDHGCDSISTVFVAISACIAVQLGHHPSVMFFQCFCAITLFYCAHWQTYVSGMLRFGQIDVTEAQFAIIFIHLVSAFFGSEVWATKLPYVEMELKMALGGGGVCLAAYIFCLNMSVIFTGGVGKNGSSVAGTSVLSPIIPLITVIVPAFTIWWKSEQNLYENHPILYIISFGLVAAKVTNRLVVAHMSKSEMEYLDSSLVGPLLLFLNQYFNCFIPEYYVLWTCLIYVTLDLVWYSHLVCQEICDHLHIKLFSITPKETLSHHSAKNGTPVISTSSSTEKVTARSTRSKRHHH